MKSKFDIKNKKGSILILSLVFLTIAIFTFAYIIDTQRLQLARQKLYIAADMAALAGAREIDEDKAMGLESALPDSPSNGPIAEILPTGCNVAQYIINQNQFDKGGKAWLGHDGSQIEMKDCKRDNGRHSIPEERRMATITVTTQYTVKPYILPVLMNDTTVQAEGKSVVYLVLN
ncbi:MAG: pilus assembly protein TadG-related protein [Bacillota bacterium]